MSSLNPFTRKREKKEEEIKTKIEQLQQHQLQQSELQSEQPKLIFTTGADEEEVVDRYASENFDKYLPASAQVEQAPTFSYSGGDVYEPPSRVWQCFSKLQSGFMIGGALGGAFGFMYGAYAAVVYKHILYLPIAVVQAGGAFGFFLACGTVIRCDEQQLLMPPPQLREGASRPTPQLAAAIVSDPGYCAVVSAVLGAGGH